MSSKNYAIIRFEKHHDFAKIAAADGHNRRLRPVSNADDKKANQMIIGEGRDLQSYIENRYTELNVRKRTGGKNKAGKITSNVLALEYVTTFTSQPPGMNLTDWIAENVKFFEEKFGRDNIAQMVLHLDEKTPHIHTFITPIRQATNGRFILSARNWIGDKKKLTDQQTEYHKKMARFGLDRGVKGSAATHQEVKKYYTTVLDANSGVLSASQLTAEAMAMTKTKWPPDLVANRLLKTVSIADVETYERRTKRLYRAMEKLAIRESEKSMITQAELIRVKNDMERLKEQQAKFKKRSQSEFSLALDLDTKLTEMQDIKKILEEKFPEVYQQIEAIRHENRATRKTRKANKASRIVKPSAKIQRKNETAKHSNLNR